MSENPEYLTVQHLSGPKVAGLKEFYCTYGTHMTQDNGKCGKKGGLNLGQDLTTNSSKTRAQLAA